MNESITPTTTHFTAYATLAAIGAKMKQLDLFGPIKARVQIKQKTIKHTPIDTLMDALISLLAGAHGLVEINTRLRADPGLRASRLADRPVLSSRSCKRRWMPAPLRTSNNCIMRLMRSIALTVKAFSTTTRLV